MDSKKVILAGVGVSILTLIIVAMGQLGLFVSSSQTILVVIAAIVFLAFYVSNARERDDHRHDSGRGVTGPLGAWIAVTLAVVVVMTPPNVVSGSRIDDSKIRIPDTSDATTSSHEDEPISSNVLEILGGEIEKPVTFETVVGPDRDGWVYAYRYSLACCVVDLWDSGVMIHEDDLPSGAEMGDWIHIEGVGHRDSEDVTWIEVFNAEQIEPLRDPYLPAGD